MYATMELTAEESGRMHPSNSELVESQIMAIKDPKEFDAIVGKYGENHNILCMVALHPQFPSASDLVLSKVVEKAEKMITAFNPEGPEYFKLDICIAVAKRTVANRENARKLMEIIRKKKC